jgi:hypothetical protein
MWEVCLRQIPFFSFLSSDVVSNIQQLGVSFGECERDRSESVQQPFGLEAEKVDPLGCD